MLHRMKTGGVYGQDEEENELQHTVTWLARAVWLYRKPGKKCLNDIESLCVGMRELGRKLG
jgi:hypothetical protein